MFVAVFKTAHLNLFRGKNLVQSLTSYFFETQFNIILYSSPKPKMNFSCLIFVPHYQPVD